MSKNDGGPAFGHGAENGHCCGLTKREYYKAAALQGLLASTDGYTLSGEETIYQHMVKHATLYADSMLSEDEAFNKKG